MLAYSSSPCRVVCWIFLTSHLLLLKARSFLSIQIVQSMMSLRSNQNLAYCLEKKEPSSQESHDPNQEASKAPFWFAFAFILFTISMEIPHNLPTNLWSQNLCAILFMFSRAHVPGSALKVKIRNTRECVLMAYPLQYLALK